MTPPGALVAADALCATVVEVDIDQRPADVRATLGTGGDIAFAVTAPGDLGARRFVAMLNPCQLAQHPQRIFADLVGAPETPIAAATPLDVVSAMLEHRQGRAVAVVSGEALVAAVTQASLQRALLARERQLLVEAQANGDRLTLWSRRLEGLHSAARQLLQLLGEHLLERDSLQQAIEVLAHLLDARYGALGLLDRQGQLITFVHTGLSAAEVAAIGAPPSGRGLLGAVVDRDEVLRLDDLRLDPRATGFPAGHPEMRHLLAVPVSHRGDVFGRIYLCDKRSGEAFSEDDERLTRCLAGSVSAMLVSARALEQQRQAELRARESQKHEAIGRLAGGIAHDFNNLLTIMACGAELIAAHSDAPAPIHESAIDIREATSRAAELTRQLLAFGRKRAPAQPRLVAINPIVEDLARILRRVLGDQFTLALELDPAAPSIRADVGELDQIVMNLVINARDAMADGGVIRVATRPSPAAGGPLRVEVCDTGAGIAEIDLPHIFEPYFTTKVSGTGLGLATIDGIVRGLGGRIEVTSTRGRGSCFAVLLPAASDGAVDDGPMSLAAAFVAGRGERILVVEDSVAVCRLIVDVLVRAGYQVQSFGLGREALAAMVGHRGELDLLVSDVDMPELGGLELAAAMRAASPTLKVLFLAGAAEVELGPLDHMLRKPFTPQVLTQEVRSLLER